MPDLPDPKDCLLEAILSGLGSSPLDSWEDIKRYIGADRPAANTDETKGRDIINELEAGSLKQECLRLINLCSDFDNGLVILKNACAQKIRSLMHRKKVEKYLLAYASQLENQPAFKQTLVDASNQPDIELAWIESLDNNINVKDLKHILQAMSQPGEPLADDAEAKKFLAEGETEDYKRALKRLLQNKPPSVTEEFRERLQISESVRYPSEPMLFLHVLVEPDFNEESIYQFKAELVQEGASIPTSFDPARESDGAWPKGPIADLPLHLGKWHERAKRISARKLCMEIFLPYVLLAECPSLEIAVPNDPDWLEWESLKLAASGPYVLRSLERARMANKQQVWPLRLKCQSLQQGASVLRPVSKDSQLEPNSLHQGLAAQNMAGFLMLHDLPKDAKRRSALIWNIINSGTPLFSWWNPQPANDVECKISDEPTDRWGYLNLCLELNGAEHDIQQDIKAPAHVHFPEAVANTRFNLAGEAECRSWIHRIVILHDHPDRWPKSILYEQEIGGSLQSPS